jgi:hypothetical protein
MTRYHWTVFFAAWIGWGFDVFDGLLFNFVAPVCVPQLLGLAADDPTAPARDAAVTGIVTSALLVGWATGGILFGWVTDRLGRARTLQLTILTYAVATAACALAPDVWTLAGLRFIASLGIGGEWAAGASLVAEVVPPSRRVAAGALLYTSAPAGILLAGLITDLLTKRVGLLAAQPDLAWRLVFVNRVRRRRRLQLLPARAVPDPAARDGLRLLLQHRSLPGGGGSVHRRAGARGGGHADGRDPLGRTRSSRRAAPRAGDRRDGAARAGGRLGSGPGALGRARSVIAHAAAA